MAADEFVDVIKMENSELFKSSNSSDDQNLEVIKEEFKSQVQEQFINLKIKDFIFLNTETPIFVVLPNDVMIASMGAMKDMLTDPSLKTTLCTLERANRVLKGQFRDIDIWENATLLNASVMK